MPEAHWEHGYRMHGLWDSLHPAMRIGGVGLSPAHITPVIYTAFVEIGASPEQFTVQTHSLRHAKTLVETYCRQHGYQISRPNPTNL